MNRISFILFFLYQTLSFGQSAPQSDNTKISFETEWISSTVSNNQAQSWKAKTESEPHNEEAWLNYFNALRISFLEKSNRKLTSKELNDLQAIGKNVSVYLKNSFADNYIQYILSEKKDDGWSFLLKAWEIRQDPDLIDDLVCYYYIQQNSKKYLEFNQKLLSSNVIPPAFFEYNQNVLSSIEAHATLITYGYADTYPLLILQNIYNIRKDVKIVCLDWIKSQRYQNMLQIEYGLSAHSMANESNLVDALLPTEGYLYFGLTLPSSLIKPYAQNLYCTGLTMKYSPTPVSNVPGLISNWNALFKKKHISAEDDINVNYLVPLSIMKEHFKNSKDPQPDDIDATYNLLIKRLK